MPSETPARNPSGRWLILAAVGFVVLIQAAWWGFGDLMVARGVFADGDSYTRLIRAERLALTGDWLDARIPRANAPHGTSVHWTRPFDVLLLILALPLLPALGLKSALFWAGVVVSPLLHVALAAAVAWATTPLLGRFGGAIAGALTATQVGVLGFSLVGRADHHMMFVCLAALAIGFLIRSLFDVGGGTTSVFRAGLCLAMGLWVGPEFLVLMALLLIVIGLPWLTGARGSARRGVGLTGGLLAGLMIAVAIERWSTGFFDISYDRVSIVHVSMVALLMVFWVVADRVTVVSRAVRAGLAIGGAVVVATAMHFLFPKFLGNPLVADADPAIGPIFTHISEYRPIADVARFLIYFGSILLVGPWMIWRLCNTWNGTERWAWLLVAVGLVLFLIMGISWLRWCLYAALFLCIALADMIVATDSALTRRFRFPARVPIKVAAILVLSVGPLMIGVTLLYAEKTPADRAAAKLEDCPIRLLAPLLEAPPWSSRPRTIVASANFGPELMYRTRHRVVATVHHRNIDGILDGYRILNGVDDAASRALVQSRAVELILLCPGTANDAYFLIGKPVDALYRRLTDGSPPPWLRPVALPDALGEKFRLFEVQVDR